jgi:GNAT superfamily N-acetyltransferase
MHGKFVVGQVYHNLGHGMVGTGAPEGRAVQPFVQPWVYRGFEVKPNGPVKDQLFYRFCRFQSGVGEPDGECILVPSLTQAEESYLTWDELMIAISHLDEEERCYRESQSEAGPIEDGRITIVEADLSRAEHQHATVRLLDGYSSDPMGAGHPLSDTARANLIPGLRKHPTTMVFLAFCDNEPVGLAICFLGFSTFAARPLVNIHDYFVSPGVRGTGVGRLLMGAVEQRARALGCCKLTLEVQENNHRARGIYAAAGFARTVYMDEAGGALFLSKPL